MGQKPGSTPNANVSPFALLLFLAKWALIACCVWLLGMGTLQVLPSFWPWSTPAPALFSPADYAITSMTFWAYLLLAVCIPIVVGAAVGFVVFIGGSFILVWLLKILQYIWFIGSVLGCFGSLIMAGLAWEWWDNVFICLPLLLCCVICYLSIFASLGSSKTFGGERLQRLVDRVGGLFW